MTVISSPCSSNAHRALRRTALAALIPGIVLLTSCDSDDSGPSGPSEPPEEETVEFALSATVSGSGTLGSSPAGLSLAGDGASGSADFEDGTSVTLTATPEDGWEIEAWSGACTSAGTSSTCQLSLTEARSMGVVFAEEEEDEPDLFALSASISGEGTLTSSPAGLSLAGDGASGSADFEDGTSVTLTATPEDGWEIEAWSGACASAGTSSTCQLSLTEARSMGVVFAEEEEEAGSVSIQTAELDQAFRDFAMDASLEATSDPAGADLTWSLDGGALPAGVELSGSGEIGGVPQEDGSFSFSIRVETTSGATDVATLELEVCPGAIDLSAGESVTLEAPSSCGVLLADDPGRTYRVGIMPRSGLGVGSTDLPLVGGGLRLELRAGTPGAFEAPSAAPMVLGADLHGDPRSDDRWLRPDGAGAAGQHGEDEGFPNTASFHAELREQELDELGPLLGDIPLGPPVLRDEHQAAPPEERSFYVRHEGAVHEITAVLRGVGDGVLFYQDEASLTADNLSDSAIEDMLAYYDDWGAPVIQASFGGLAPTGTIGSVFTDDEGAAITVNADDIDGTGRLTVLWVRESLFPEGVAGYVSGCDRYPHPDTRQTNSPLGPCNGSNQAEITYMRTLSPHVLVHEVKHISSHGWAVYAGRGFNHTWVEEGTAEIAREQASRGARGFAPGERAGATWWDGNDETLGIWNVLVRSNHWLGDQPDNPLFGRSAENRWGYYGASWLYHRYLADVWAPGQFATEAAFFLQLNTGGLSHGGIESALGVQLEDTLPGFLAALATGGASGGANDFRSYDFEAIAQSQSALDAWPVPIFQQSFSSAELDWSPTRSSILTGELQNSEGTFLLLNLRRTDGDPVSGGESFVLSVTRTP